LDLYFKNLHAQLPLIFLVPRLGWELEQMTSFTQKYDMGWNYNDNLSTAIRIKSDKNFDSYMYIRTIFYTKNTCYYNFNLRCIFEQMTSSAPTLNQAPEQRKLMAAVNSRK